VVVVQQCAQQFDVVGHDDGSGGVARGDAADHHDASGIAFDVNSYIELGRRWGPRADRYRATKPAADFPGVAGRRRQRAYFDSVRDLLIPKLGPLRVVRVPVPECDPTVAFERYFVVREQRAR
jgi:hypothetical protein